MATYKTFIISKWDSDTTGLTQYATTWQIAKDSNFANMVINDEEDTTNIYEWKVNIEVPSNEVWYIRAKRHLKDSDGNVVNYDKYIGPEPIFSDETNVNELLVPDMYIEQPIIKSLNMDESSISISLSDPIGNVPNIKTYVAIYKDGVMKYSASVDSLDITITPQDVDYIGLNDFEIVLIHTGDFGVISDKTLLKVSYSDNLFEIIGNLFNMDPVNVNIIKIASRNANGVQVSYASVMDMDTGNIIDCPVKNSTEIYIEPDKLIHDHKLILRVYINYIDPVDNQLKTVEKKYPISFGKYNEVDNTILNVTYQYVIEFVATINEPICDNGIILMEESSTGLIPFVKNNFLVLGVLTPENDEVRYINTNTGIGLVSGWQDANLQIVDINGVDYLMISYYTNATNFAFCQMDYVSNAVSKTVRTYQKTDPYIAKLNNIIYYGNELSVAYYDSANNRINIAPVDISITSLIEKYYINLPSDISDITTAVVTHIDQSRLLILPIGGSANYCYIYDITYNKLYKGDDIPTEFRDTMVTGIRLLNGNVLYTPVDKAFDNYSFMVYDVKSNSLNTYSYDIGVTDPIPTNIVFKDRTIDKVYIKNDITNIYRIH